MSCCWCSNWGAEWDSQDSGDHHCQPEDPHASRMGSSPKKKMRLVCPICSKKGDSSHCFSD